MVVSSDHYRSALVRDCLEQAGYRVWLAETAQSLALAISAIKPDLLLLDWKLPDQNSLALIRDLRSDRQAAGLLIILWGTDMKEEDIMLGLEAGADMCLREPFHPQVLVARVRAVLRRSQAAGSGS